MILKLNGTEIKNPSSFEIERYNITKSGRLANGEMAMDLIAKKKKFLLSYDVLSAEAFDAILSVIDEQDMFFTLDYEYQGSMRTATVYVGAITQRRFRTTSGWYWKNVTFNLIEK